MQQSRASCRSAVSVEQNVPGMDRAVDTRRIGESEGSRSRYVGEGQHHARSAREEEQDDTLRDTERIQYRVSSENGTVMIELSE